MIICPTWSTFAQVWVLVILFNRLKFLIDVSSCVKFHCVCSAAWPRYRILRSSDIGQNNLEISNAELSDDSLYECQATEAALRSRRAKLSVLGKRSYQRYLCVCVDGCVLCNLFIWRIDKGSALLKLTDCIKVALSLFFKKTAKVKSSFSLFSCSAQTNIRMDRNLEWAE